MTFRSMRVAFLFCALALICACNQNTNEDAAAIHVDILIENGHVFSGRVSDELRTTDIGVSSDRIVFVGDAEKNHVIADVYLDASGLIVAPGFIDPHTHSMVELLSQDRNSNLNYLTQGVTTVFNGNDGAGPADLRATIDKLEANGIGTNTALYVGHGSVRRMVMNGDNRHPTMEELARMSKLVDEAMRSGAMGLSTGLYYVPGNFAETDEIISLARVAANYGGVYDTHLRDESTYNIGFLSSVEETLLIGQEAEIPVHFAHIKALGVDVWGQSAAAIELIEAARASGQQVTADQYPWRASGTHLRNALVPRRILSGEKSAYLKRLGDPTVVAEIFEEMVENLRRRGGADSLLVTVAKDPGIAGHMLAEIARQRELDPIETAIEIILEGPTRIASFNMNASDIEAFMQKEWVMTSSDGTDGHPRKYASFPKKYREYVVRRAVLSVEDFLYRSSGLAAETFGLEKRGRIESGYFADIIAFQPEKFAPVADFGSWNELSTGVVFTTINGQLVLKNGQYTDILPGRVLRKLH